MGYTTEFRGEFTVTPALTPEQVAYINRFSETRRMQRDPQKAALLPDPIREAVGLPLGKEAEYFVGGGGFAGQEHDASILDYNNPPAGQPGLWCQWEAGADGVRWNGGEKFYYYVDWLEYLIANFFQPWGRTLNGEVEWRGEDWDDTGTIRVENNVIVSPSGYRAYANRRAM